jgi:T-complex protein 1 subunit alpha
LKKANDLIKGKVHPTNIIAGNFFYSFFFQKKIFPCLIFLYFFFLLGYKIAVREACEFIKNNMAVAVKDLGRDALVNCARTSMSSKLIGPESKFFAELAVEAI